MLGLYNKVIQSLDNYPNVVKQSTVSWTVYNGVQTDLTCEWGIDADAIPVSKDYSFLQDIFSSVQVDYQFVQNTNYVFNSISSDYVLPYSIAGTVAKDYIIAWDNGVIDENYHKIINANSFADYDYILNLTPGADITASSFYDPGGDNRASPDKAFSTDDDRVREGAKWVSTAGNPPNIPSNTADPSAGGTLSTCWWQMRVSTARTETVSSIRLCSPDNLYDVDSTFTPANTEFLSNTPSRIRVLISPDVGFGTPANITVVMSERAIPFSGFANWWTEWLKLTSTFTTDTDVYMRVEIWEMHTVNGTYNGVSIKALEFTTEIEEKYVGLESFLTDSGAVLGYLPYRPESELVDSVVIQNRINPGNGDLTVTLGGGTIVYTHLLSYSQIMQPNNIYAGLHYTLTNPAKMESGSGAVALDQIKNEWTLMYTGAMEVGSFRLNASDAGTPVLEVTVYSSLITLSWRNGDGVVDTGQFSRSYEGQTVFITRDAGAVIVDVWESSDEHGISRRLFSQASPCDIDTGFSVSQTNPITVNPSGTRNFNSVALWPRKISRAEQYTALLLSRVSTNISSQSLAINRFNGGKTTCGETFESIVCTDASGIATTYKQLAAYSYYTWEYGVSNQYKLEHVMYPDQGGTLGEFSTLLGVDSRAINRLFGNESFSPLYLGFEDKALSGENSWENTATNIQPYNRARLATADWVSYSIVFSPVEDAYKNTLIPLLYQYTSTTWDHEKSFVTIMISNRYLYVWYRKDVLDAGGDYTDYPRYEIECPYSMYGCGKVSLITVNIPLIQGNDIELIVDGILVGTATLSITPHRAEPPVTNSTFNYVNNTYCFAEPNGFTTRYFPPYFGDIDAAGVYSKTASNILGIHTSHNDTHLHGDKLLPVNIRVHGISSTYRKIDAADDRLLFIEGQKLHATTNLAGFVFDKSQYNLGYYPLWETDTKEHQEYLNNGFPAKSLARSSVYGNCLGYNQNGYTGGVLSHKKSPRDIRILEGVSGGHPYTTIGDADRHVIDFYATPIIRADAGVSTEPTWRPRNVFLEMGGRGSTGWTENTAAIAGLEIPNIPLAQGTCHYDYDPVNNIILMASSWYDIGGGTRVAHVFKSTNGGVSWTSTPQTQFGATANIYSYAHDGGAGFGVWVALVGSGGTNLWSSEDGGDTWTIRATDVGGVYDGYWIRHDKSSMFICAIKQGSSSMNAFVSTDGITWTFGGNHSFGGGYQMDDFSYANGEWATAHELTRIGHFTMSGGSIATSVMHTTTSNWPVFWIRYVPLYNRWYWGGGGGHVFAGSTDGTMVASSWTIIINGANNPQGGSSAEHFGSYIKENGHLVVLGDGYLINFSSSTGYSYDQNSFSTYSDLKAGGQIGTDTFMLGVKSGTMKHSYIYPNPATVFSIGTNNAGDLQVGRRTSAGSELLTFASLATVKLHHVVVELEGERVTTTINGATASFQDYATATGDASLGSDICDLTIGHGTTLSGSYVIDSESTYLLSHLGFWKATAANLPVTAFAPRYDKATALTTQYLETTRTPIYKLSAQDLVDGAGNNTIHADGNTVSNWHDTILGTTNFGVYDGSVSLQQDSNSFGTKWDGSFTPAVYTDAGNTINDASRDRLRNLLTATLNTTLTSAGRLTMITTARSATPQGDDNGQYTSNLVNFTNAYNKGVTFGYDSSTLDSAKVINSGAFAGAGINQYLKDVAVTDKGYDISGVCVIGNSWHFSNSVMAADGWSDVQRTGGVSATGKPGSSHPRRDISNPEDDLAGMWNDDTPLVRNYNWIFGWEQNSGNSPRQFNGYLAEVVFFDYVYPQWQYNLLHIRKNYEHGLTMGIPVESDHTFIYDTLTPTEVIETDYNFIYSSAGGVSNDYNFVWDDNGLTAIERSYTFRQSVVVYVYEALYQDYVPYVSQIGAIAKTIEENFVDIVAPPGIISGDLLFVFMVVDGSSVGLPQESGSSAWTYLSGSGNNSGTAVECTYYYRLANGTESGQSYRWTTDKEEHIGCIIVVKNSQTGHNALNKSGASSTASNFAFTSTQLSENPALIIDFFGWDHDNPFPITFSANDGRPLTEYMQDVSSTSAGAVTMGLISTSYAEDLTRTVTSVTEGLASASEQWAVTRIKTRWVDPPLAAATLTRYINVNSPAGGDGTTAAISGANRAYSGIAEWQTAEGATDLVGLNRTMITFCSGGIDTSANVLHGNRIFIGDTDPLKTDSKHCFAFIGEGAGVGGIYDSSKYSLEADIGLAGITYYLLSVQANAVRFDRMQFVQISPYTDNAGVVTNISLVRIEGGTKYTQPSRIFTSCTFIAPVDVSSMISVKWPSGIHGSFSTEDQGVLAINCQFVNLLHGIEGLQNAKLFNCTIANSIGSGLLNLDNLLAINVQSVGSYSGEDRAVSATLLPGSTVLTNDATGTSGLVNSNVSFADSINGDLRVDFFWLGWAGRQTGVGRSGSSQLLSFYPEYDILYRYRNQVSPDFGAIEHDDDDIPPPTQVVSYVNTLSPAGGDGTTNATSGANRAYSTLKEWQTVWGLLDLVATNQNITVYCSGGADTSAVTTFSIGDVITIGTNDSSLTDDTHKYTIIGEGCGVGGEIDTGKYHLTGQMNTATNNNPYFLYVRAWHLDVFDMQFMNSSPYTANGQGTGAAAIRHFTSGGVHNIVRCTFAYKYDLTGLPWTNAMSGVSNSQGTNVINCTFSNMLYGVLEHHDSSTITNCTANRCAIGFSTTDATCTIENSMAINSITADIEGSWVSEVDTLTSDATGTIANQTVAVVDVLNGDLTVVSPGTWNGYRAGSAVGGLVPTDDINGNTRNLTTPDIGAVEHDDLPPPTQITRYINTAATPGGDGTTNNLTGSTAAWSGMRECGTATLTIDPIAENANYTIYCEGAAADSSIEAINTADIVRIGTKVTTEYSSTDNTRGFHFIGEGTGVGGSIDTNKYRLEGVINRGTDGTLGSASDMLRIESTHNSFTGMQFHTTGADVVGRVASSYMLKGYNVNGRVGSTVIDKCTFSHIRTISTGRNSSLGVGRIYNPKITNTTISNTEYGVENPKEYLEMYNTTINGGGVSLSAGFLTGIIENCMFTNAWSVNMEANGSLTIINTLTSDTTGTIQDTTVSYVDAAAGNLTVVDPSVSWGGYNAGSAVGGDIPTDDINGNARNTNNPDIGAVEHP